MYQVRSASVISFEWTRYLRPFTPILSGIITRYSAESGGALYNAGALAVNASVFASNTAGKGGLAIHDEGSYIVLENVTFHENMFSCPAEQYSDAHHVSAFNVYYWSNIVPGYSIRS